MTRTAISPRFAIKTFENTVYLPLMGIDRAKAALADSRFADVRWTDETGSTNTDAMEILLENRREDPNCSKAVVVVADYQSAGRGRLAREWESPPGASLLMSVGTTADIDPLRRGLLLTALGVAAVEGVFSTTGFRPSLKWPNDLVAAVSGDLGELKLGGILAESRQAGDGVATVIGLGLNCNWDEVPEELASIAVSLNRLMQEPIDRVQLLIEIVRRFDRNLDLLSSDSGVEELLGAARVSSATLGRKVRVELEGSVLEGTAVDIAPDGALVVESSDGESHRVVVGDVIHLRSQD